MQYSEFIGQVQNRAKLATEEEALKATRAVLETLGNRLFTNESSHLAAQLPEEIGHFLKDKPSEKLSYDQFIYKIVEKEGVRTQDALYHARAVFEVVREAVSQGEIDDVKAQLPQDLENLFEAGSAGQFSAQ